ncbi:hypothetical protein V3589_11425 [Sinorhizobium fredii]|uniref:hypothetical protein n=1 Tax=Rhizobium fredii TaxID=380 RepID=UPI0030A4E29F
MPSYKSDLVDIACQVVRDDPDQKAIAVADGTEESYTDDHGVERTRLKWFWLPRSQIQMNDNGTVTMPEWLAVDKGLV